LQPVYNPKVIYNYQIKKEQTQIETANIYIYKRELVKEIKSAYFGYLMTVYLLKLADETNALLRENLRVSKSLYKNDKATKDVVYRSEAELQNAFLGRAVTEKENQTAKSYFNFLLNKPLDSEIKIAEIEKVPDLVISDDMDQGISKGLSSREELNQLQSYSEINESFKKLARSSNYPNLFLAVDYGFQGEEYSFTDKDDFLLASVVLRWNLFQGMKNRADVQYARIASEQIKLKKRELEKQIELQVIQAYYDLKAAKKAIDAAQIQVQASENAFKVVKEKFRNGQARLIEYTDARTTKTRSKQNLINTIFEYKTKEAELERVTADRNFN
jgi:outer membrane protein TolC